MDELLKILQSLAECLHHQVTLVDELMPILDAEEDALSRYNLTDFQNVVVVKDQLVWRLQQAETRRVQLLSRLCFFISYDTRRGLPKLSELLLALQAYCNNVQPLVEKNIHTELLQTVASFEQAAGQFRKAYAAYAPRIYRNQVVLQKLRQNVARSLALFESECIDSTRYNAQGKTQGADAGYSQLRVRA